MAPKDFSRPKTQKDRNTEYSVDEIKSHSSPDDLWIIIQGKVYDVTRWLKNHPGGDVVLRGVGGEDASIPFISYHPKGKKMDIMMNSFQIGIVKDYKNSNVTVEFEKLRERLYEDGMFETDYNYYYFICSMYVLLLATLVYCLVSENTLLILFGALLLGLFWQQVAFIGHDVGHNSVTHVRELDWYIGVAVTFFFGVSGQWWKRSHNTHHIFPNSLDWDPDIQHLPFIAIDGKLFNGIFSFYHGHRFEFDAVAQIFIRLQHILFFPIMGLARNFMYVQSWILVLNTNILVYHRAKEILALFGYWVWYLAVLSYVPTWKLRLAVHFIAHGFCGILHHQITLSHFAMPAYMGTGYDNSKANDHFINVQLSTTTDIAVPKWMDWFHGGLQFQTAHHLFPLVPRHNLRKLREKYLVPFCRKHGLNYLVSDGFLSTTWTVLMKLYTQAQAVANGKHIAFQESMLAELLHSTTES